MNKDLKKLFGVFALYSLGSGFIYTFQELWLKDNGLSIKTIGTVYSLCAFLAIAVLFFSSSLVKNNKLKVFSTSLLITKFTLCMFMFFINGSGLNNLIKLLVIMDYVVDTEFYACFYPMMSMINKSDKVYAWRTITYDIMFYLGAFFATFTLGKTISKLIINYNSFLLIGCFFLLIGILLEISIDLNKYIKIKSKLKKNYSRMLSNIFKDKITIYYLLFVLLSNISYYAIVGVIMLVFTEGIGYSPVTSSIIIMALGISSAIFGSIVISKLTLKNDYINISIKYLIKPILYLIAFIFNNNIFFVIAIIYAKLLNDSYEHISDAPYVNRFSKEEQFEFNNIRDSFKYLGRSIGTLICGIAITITLRLNFALSFVFGIIAVIVAYYLLSLKNNENNN